MATRQWQTFKDLINCVKQYFINDITTYVPVKNNFCRFTCRRNVHRKLIVFARTIHSLTRILHFNVIYASVFVFADNR